MIEMDRVEQLACWAFDCSRTELYTGDYMKGEPRIGRFFEALKKSACGMPIQYIMGDCEFMGLKFFVSPSVFIPRPETEILIENTLRLIKEEHLNTPYVLDIGTGAGAIAVSLTKYDPSCKIVASDISEDALKVALDNARFNGVDGRIKFVLADLFLGIGRRESFDLIISNPPYIPSDDYDNLPFEVKYEPKVALDGGRKGLDFYKKMIPESAKRLKSKGFLILEMGFGQAEAIRDLIDRSGTYCEIKILKDYNGIDRVIFAKRR